MYALISHHLRDIQIISNAKSFTSKKVKVKEKNESCAIQLKKISIVYSWFLLEQHMFMQKDTYKQDLSKKAYKSHVAHFKLAFVIFKILAF